MARSTKDEVKALMKGLDLLHIKYIHIWVNNQFLENDRYEEYLEMLNEWEIDGYYECYNDSDTEGRYRCRLKGNWY